MRISDWSSDVCSSDLQRAQVADARLLDNRPLGIFTFDSANCGGRRKEDTDVMVANDAPEGAGIGRADGLAFVHHARARSEERRVGNGCVSTFRSRWSPDQ